MISLYISVFFSLYFFLCLTVWHIQKRVRVLSTDCSNYFHSHEDRTSPNVQFKFIIIFIFISPSPYAITANLLAIFNSFNYHLNKKIVMVPLSIVRISLSVSVLIWSVLFCCQYILLNLKYLKLWREFVYYPREKKN